MVSKLIPRPRWVSVNLSTRNLEAVDYYCKPPEDIEERGYYFGRSHAGHRVAAVHRFFKEKGAGNIGLVSLIAPPKGGGDHQNHPDVEILRHTDECLKAASEPKPGP